MLEEVAREKVNIIYESTLPNVLEGIEDTFYEEVKKCYFEYIQRIYYKIFIQDCYGIEVEECVKKSIKIEEDNWKDEHPDIKLSLLLDDEYLYKIKKLTGWTLRAATERIETGKTLTDREQYLDFFKKSIEYFPKVRSFNQGLARQLLGDARLDIDYAYGKSDLVSLRCASEAGV